MAFAESYIDHNGNINLKFDRQGKFKIMQLTDLHFGENMEADEKTVEEIQDMIRKEEPDFVAVTGDIVSGFAWDHYTGEQDFWKHNFAKLHTILDTEQIPYGIVPGYHDFEADVDQEKMMELVLAAPYSVTRYNSYQHNGRDMHHQFTYQVPIRNNYDQNEVQARLWFFGTGRDNCMGTGGMDCVRRDQIEWFKDESRMIADDD